MAAVLVALLGALLAVQSGLAGEPLYLPSESWQLAAFVAALLAGAGCAVFAYRSPTSSAGLIVIAAAGVALMVPLQVALPSRVLERLGPTSIIERHAMGSADTIIVSDARLVGAVEWALKRDDIYVITPGEIEYGLSYPESRRRWLEGEALGRLIAANAGRHEILIICWSVNEARVEPQLPPMTARSQHGDVVFWRLPPS